MSLHFTRADLSDATEISAILEEWYLANSWIPPVHDPVERADYGRVLLDHSEAFAASCSSSFASNSSGSL